MSEDFYPFDSGIGATRTEDDWRLLAKAMQCAFKSGVIPGEGNELAAYGDSTGMHVKLPTGIAGIVGHVYNNTAEQTINVAAAGGTIRWDRLVLAADFTANTITAVVKLGTSDPLGPALTQNRTSLWEQPIAFIQVRVGTSTIAGTDVFLDAGRYGSALGGLPLGSVIDHIAHEGQMPVGYQVADGHTLDWHYVPGLKAIAPTYTGATHTFGFDPGTNLIHFPDLRGRVVAGPDAMGGTAASRLASSFNNGVAADAAGGEDTHLLDTTETPTPVGSYAAAGKSNIHYDQQVLPIADGDGADTLWLPSKAWVVSRGGADLAGQFIALYHEVVAGSLVPHNNVQPTLLMNKFVKVY